MEAQEILRGQLSGSGSIKSPKSSSLIKDPANAGKANREDSRPAPPPEKLVQARLGYHLTEGNLRPNIISATPNVLALNIAIV